MNASGGNAVPIDRRELLAAADPCARALVALVRRLVDELEEAAPWRLLLAEPPELADLEQRVMRLLEIIEQTPGRIASALGSLPGAPIADSVREEAKFYFAALHQMTAADRRLLRAALDRTPPPATLSEAAGAYLAEVAADLKGKYASAMMGAAAALVSDGRSLGVDVEASLFPKRPRSKRATARSCRHWPRPTARSLAFASTSRGGPFSRGGAPGARSSAARSKSSRSFARRFSPCSPPPTAAPSIPATSTSCSGASASSNAAGASSSSSTSLRGSSRPSRPPPLPRRSMRGSAS